MPSYRLLTGAASSAAAPSARHVVASFHDFDRAFCAARSVDEQRAIAALVPAEPAAVPEAHALQADLLLRVWRLRPDPSLPPWRHLPLPGSSRLAWARLALRVDPAGCRAIAIDEPALLASALEGLDMLAAPDPRAVLEALFEANDAAAERALRDALPQAVARGLLSPPDARAMLVRRGDAWAFSNLALPWASGLPLPLPELRRALRGEAAKAALQAAAARGLWGEIRFLLTPPRAYDTDEASTDWALRRAAVEQAGRLGDNETVGELLALALVAPFELGDETLRALVAMHRRGHFVRANHVDAVLALLAAGATLPVDELAGLLFVARREIMAKLPADADDPLWLVLAPLLARWRLAPRPPAGLLEALQRLAREARRPALLETVLGLLRGLAIDVAELDHGRLEASAALRLDQALEALALRRLDDAPEAALGLLEATAGEAARALLGRRSGDESDQSGKSGKGNEGDESAGRLAEALAPYAERALLVLWHATPPAERAGLVEALDPTCLPNSLVPLLRGDAFDGYARDALELRRGADDPDAIMLSLCAVASPADLPRLELGLLRAIEKAASTSSPPGPFGRSARTSDDGWHGSPSGETRHGEEAQQLARPIAEALDALEARWKRGHRRPAWLLAPGPRLRAELLLRAVEAAPARVAVLAALLRSLLGLEHPRLPAAAARLLDHADDDVAKLAARLLAQGGAAWLSLELSRGAVDADDRRARACMQALAVAGGPAAEAAALGLLERRTMNLKKTGAKALAKLATPPSVPRLLHWLGQHDDPGLRAALREALRTALGEGVLPALLAAMAGADGDERRQGLLVRELDGLVDPPLARVLLRQAPGWARSFFEAVSAGVVALRGAEASDVAAELHAFGLRPPEAPAATPPRSPFAHAVDDLARLGWSPERATAALACWPEALAAEALAALRRELHRWLETMVRWRDVRPAALLEAVLSAGPDATELAWLREAAPALAELLRTLPPHERASLWTPLERLIDRLGPLDRLDLGASFRATLGATPGLTRSPLAALRRCGMVLRRDDVERAFRGVADVPDPTAVRRAILADAFDVEGPAPHEAEPEGEATRLHELADETARGPLEALSSHLDAMEALRPIGVSAWTWPTPPPLQRQRPPKPRSPTGPAARTRELAAWLSGHPAGPAPSVARFREALPDEVIGLVQDAEAAERLLHFLSHRGTPALRHAYRPWLEEQAGRATGSALAELHAALTPPRATPLWSTPEARERLRERQRARFTTPSNDLPVAAVEATEADRALWRREALANAPEAARRALTLLARAPDAQWPPLVLRAARHPSARVRAHALRLIRRTLERATYLAAARDFLHDDDATVRRSAVRAVGHGRDPEALPALASLLLDPVKWVRDEALSALSLYGEAGLAAIGHRAARARPDEARRLTKAASELRARPDTP